MDLNETFSKIYEFLGQSGSFSDDLFQGEIYTNIGIAGLVISLLLATAFYFIINRPSFSKSKHWSIILLINFIIAFVIGFIVPLNIFKSIGLQYETMQYILFGLKVAVVATLYFIFWTYCLKWWKSNAQGTPKLFLGKF